MRNSMYCIKTKTSHLYHAFALALCISLAATTLPLGAEEETTEEVVPVESESGADESPASVEEDIKNITKSLKKLENRLDEQRKQLDNSPDLSSTDIGFGNNVEKHIKQNGDNASKNTGEKIKDRQESIQKLLMQIKKWDINSAPETAGHYVDNMAKRAKAYAKSKEYMDEMRKHTGALLAAVEQWKRARSQTLSEDMSRLKKSISEVENLLDKNGNSRGNRQSNSSPKNIEDLYDFQYYEVQEPATLKEISAKTSVYGTSGMWEILYKANKNKVDSPEAEVPAGSVLIVPQAPEQREFKFE